MTKCKNHKLRLISYYIKTENFLFYDMKEDTSTPVTSIPEYVFDFRCKNGCKVIVNKDENNETIKSDTTLTFQEMKYVDSIILEKTTRGMR